MELATSAAADENEGTSTDSRHDKSEQRCEKNEEIKGTSSKKVERSAKRQRALEGYSPDDHRKTAPSRSGPSETVLSKKKNSKESGVFRTSNQRGKNTLSKNTLTSSGLKENAVFYYFCVAGICALVVLKLKLHGVRKELD